ncbi:uncharacterized protein LOC117316332 [Pecten maximus]|uniref:uncharacterized protein LOC117316332 n=1 Tax=Pecten maximus TaxID=6579 RepID=UPI001458E615|nr:uncharacterized protein LOC117316332 [Pecten maximus]
MSNESPVFVESQKVKALIDSGSMVSTLSEKSYTGLQCKPLLQSLDTLGLDVTVANGSTLNYLGYIECEVEIPAMAEQAFQVLMLVVPNTEYNSTCPVILGTNVIRLVKRATLEDSVVPKEWQAAMDSISCSFAVRMLSKKPVTIAPYTTAVINGIVRGVDPEITDLVTENQENSTFRYIVCPRVLKIKQNKANHKIPVKFCNISAKPVVLNPRSISCTVNQVQVVDNLASDLPTSQEGKLSLPEELGVHIDKTNLTEEQLLRVRQVLGNWEHAFSKSQFDLGKTNLIKHKIELLDERPFKQPYRKIPPAMYEEVRQHIKEMQEAGVIRESNSPFSSNVVLVRKKDGSLRFCIDYRMLNSRTRKDAYMLPRFDDTVDTINGSRYFSKLDLRSGYWQVEVEESDIEKNCVLSW